MSGWKFKAWSIPQLGMDAVFEVDVPDYKTGRIVEEALGRYDLFQYENNVKGDYSNILGVQACHPDHEGGEWFDVGEDEAEEYGFINPAGAA